MAARALFVSILIVALSLASVLASAAVDAADPLPVGLALLPVRDPLLATPTRTARDGTSVTIADSKIIVTGTGTADVVRTIEDVVARDGARDDGALTDVIAGIMGKYAPDAKLKQQIRDALALRAGTSADASQAFHDRMTAIVAAAAVATRTTAPDTKPVNASTPLSDAAHRSDQDGQADPRLQPLMDVLGAINSLL